MPALSSSHRSTRTAGPVDVDDRPDAFVVGYRHSFLPLTRRDREGKAPFAACSERLMDPERALTMRTGRTGSACEPTVAQSRQNCSQRRHCLLRRVSVAADFSRCPDRARRAIDFR